MRWAYVNGRLAPADQALVRADTGAVYGRGLIETMRSYGGRLFRFRGHYERLRDGAAVLGIDAPASAVDLERALIAVLDRNEAADARLRLIVTGGGPDGATVIGLATPLDATVAGSHEGGMSAVISPTPRNEMSPLSRIKSLQRVDDQLAREAARRQGADEALLLNTLGEVAECSASNVFIVSNGKLCTPALDSGALPGVTRAAVLELAAGVGIEVLEETVEVGALRGAEECFLTNSVIEVMPLTHLDGKPIGDGRPGPVTLRLRRSYRDLVARETGAQAAG